MHETSKLIKLLENQSVNWTMSITPGVGKRSNVKPPPGVWGPQHERKVTIIYQNTAKSQVQFLAKVKSPDLFFEFNHFD